MRKTILRIASCFASLVLCGVCLTAPAQAAVVHADFNDLNTGTIVGQAGGSGMSGNWLRDTTVGIVAGNLTAPSSTNFHLTQSDPGFSVQGNATSARVYRTLETPLQGDVWFSFLINPTHSGARVGIDLNSTDGSTGLRILALGSQLRVLGVAGIDFTSAEGWFALDQTSLVLGRVQINGSGDNDLISLWINPDVDNLAAPTQTFVNSNWVTSQITSVGIESYGVAGATSGGILDMLTLADGPGAYFAVTGVPEPGTWGLMSISGAALVGFALRRRQRRRMA